MKRMLTLCLLLGTIAIQAQKVIDHDFGTSQQFDSYTVIDGNSDGITWRYDDVMLAARCVRDYDADDWLVTPALSLDASKTYKLTFEVSADQEDAETFEVMTGQSATVAAMKTTVLEPQTVSCTTPHQLSAIFTVSSSGQHFIALHLLTDNPYSNTVYVNRILIEETVNQGVPAAPTELMVTPVGNGSQSATVSFRCPIKNIAGDDLTQLSQVNVWRDGTLVKTFDHPAVGEQISFEDSGIGSGNHIYKVAGLNDYGEGESAEQTVYIGNDVPGPVQNLRFVYDYDTHKAHLTWDAPTTGAHGGVIDYDHLTYTVRRFHADAPVAAGVTESAFEDEVDIDFLLECEEITRQKYANSGMTVNVNYVIDGQGLMQYYVKAVTPVGEGSETRSNGIIIGEQYTLPYEDSFAGGKTTHFWRTDITSARQRWSAMRDSRYTQDEDGGMLGFTAAEGMETAMCHTGNISMKDAQSPVLTFYYFYPYVMTYPLTIKVAKDGGDFETLTTIALSEQSGTAQYLRASVPLTGCAGHDYVQVAFEVTATTTVDIIYIDNVRIIDQRQYDLSVEIAALPRNLKVDELRYMKARVSNLGTSDVNTGQYTVDVYVSGVKAGSTMGTAIAADQSQEILVTLQANINMQEQSDLYAEVVYGADEAPENNRSVTKSISVKLPRHPKPTHLVGTMDNGQLTLVWDTPASPRTEDGHVTDSFEDYADFQRTNFGDWTLYDLDRQLTWGVGDPWHFTSNSDIHSYIIWNPSEVENHSTGEKGLTEEKWQPRTGSKCLASFGVPIDNCDDWLVSPELSGNAQIMSFYARHPSLGPEKFQLYISVSGLETTNFMAYDATSRSTTNEWTLYEYSLPEGTKYFALRKTTPTDESWALLIDDMTFCPDTLAAQTDLMFYGYNVYRNGKRLNTALVSTPTYTDAGAQAGDVYRVTAVYNQGESVYSNEVVAGATEGIEGVSKAQGSDMRSVYDLQGRPLGKKSGKGVVIVKGKKTLMK